MAEPDWYRKVSRKRLSALIADQIEVLILDGKLSQGAALPPERDLAAQFEVSRNILREAISMLCQKSLLVVRPGSGTYVIHPGEKHLRDSLEFHLKFGMAELVDLAEARLALEVEIAGLAAERCTELDCEELAACNESMAGHRGTPEEYVDADVRFHQALAAAARNGTMKVMLASVSAALRNTITTLVSQRPAAMEESLVHHRRIAESVRARDAAGARSAMRGHLEWVLQNLCELTAEGKRE